MLVACEQGGDRYVARVPVASPSISNSRVIALVGTMTGPNAERGNDAYTGADAAVAVLNRALNDRERQFELVTLDDAGDPQQAQADIQELLTKYSTVGLLFAGPPQALAASEDVLADVGVPALLQTGDLSSRQLLTPHIFRMAPAYQWQAATIADYVFSDRGYTRVGALTSAQSSGEAARRALNLEFSRVGQRLKGSELLQEGGAGVTSALRRLKKRRVQAIVVEGPPRDEGKVLAALADAGDVYSTTKSAKQAPKGEPGADGDYWGPQIVGFDSLMTPNLSQLAAGSVAAETYARGAHYLPIPSFDQFRRAYDDWWGNRVPAPLGQERRAFESVLMIGWAANQVPSSSDADLAEILETVKGKRFGGLNVTFGPDDHLAPEQASVGLWTVPNATDDIPRDAHPPAFPWVPLDRTFTSDGRHTSIARADWPYLFGPGVALGKRPPLYRACRYGITTKQSDPVH